MLLRIREPKVNIKVNKRINTLHAIRVKTYPFQYNDCLTHEVFSAMLRVEPKISKQL